MKFSILLWFLAMKVKMAVKKPSLKDFISNKNITFVIKTRDNTRGKRFIFNHGTFLTDTNLMEYHLALIWKNEDIAFNTMISSDDTALPRAVNNWELQLDGNPDLLTLFGIILNVAMGKWKRD